MFDYIALDPGASLINPLGITPIQVANTTCVVFSSFSPSEESGRRRRQA
jgi:hypothetical protein